MIPTEVRAARADAFRKAKTYCASSIAECTGRKTIFMCIALGRTAEDGLVSEKIAADCVRIIMRGLKGLNTVSELLRSNGQNLPSVQVQKFRHDWFDQLIEDHSF